MKPPVLLLLAGLSLPLTSLPALAQETADPAPAVDATALQQRIDELERENQTLRMQWGQTTMELDRLRKENERLKRGLAAEVRAPGPAASAEPAAAPSAAAAAAKAPEPSGDAALRAEVERLRRENEDLRSEKEELTELAGVTAEGENVAAADARIVATFDEKENKTVVRSQPQEVRMLAGSAADHYLSIVYSYPGRELSDRAAAEVSGYLQSRHSGGVHTGDREVEFTVDGETFTAPITRHEVSQRQTGMAGKRRLDKGDEMVAFALDAEALRKLARAVRGEGRIGNVRFELSRDDVALFKAVQRRLEKGL